MIFMSQNLSDELNAKPFTGESGKNENVFEIHFAQLTVDKQILDGNDASCVFPVGNLTVRPACHRARKFVARNMIVHIESTGLALFAAGAIRLAVFLASAISAYFLNEIYVVPTEIFEIFPRLFPIDNSSAIFFHCLPL